MVSAFQTRVKIVREVLEVNNSACDLSVYVSDAVVPADLSTQATSDVLLRTRSGTPVSEAQSPAQVYIIYIYLFQTESSCNDFDTLCSVVDDAQNTIRWSDRDVPIMDRELS